ncbi:hypothetical protein ON010_g4962 [Phytophthora cinnamomi]|nr:hypothetical protein ON010_g4962 [Phytophthora cinnamomi]
MGFFKKLFARTPEDAAASEAKAFEGIAKLNELLTKQRYVVGSRVTEADVRLFHTLIRLDVFQKKTNEKQLADFPNVVGYLRDLYQLPGLKSTVNWNHLKISAENTQPDVVVEGPFVDYDAAHERAQLA